MAFTGNDSLYFTPAAAESQQRREEKPAFTHAGGPQPAPSDTLHLAHQSLVIDLYDYAPGRGVIKHHCHVLWSRAEVVLHLYSHYSLARIGVFIIYTDSVIAR